MHPHARECKLALGKNKENPSYNEKTTLEERKEIK